MKNLRWANHEKTGVCYEVGNSVVYIDGGPEYNAILSGQYGPIENEIVIETVATSEELAANIRAERDRLLAASDWTQVADAPVDQAAWAAYRQALRDIPQQEGFPHNVAWPVKP